MPLPPTFIPANPRVRRKRRTGAVDSLAVIGALVEMADGANAVLRMTFNTSAGSPLADLSGIDCTKWTGRVDGIAYRGSTVESQSFDTLRIYFDGQGADAGIDQVSYANNPSDIADLLGRPLAAFADFPLEVV